METIATLSLDKAEQLGMTVEPSEWNPTDEEKEIRSMVLYHFNQGYTTMYKPRVEFNDLSVIGRDQTDFLAWNAYQPNNGDPYEGDEVNGWRSNALRPIERNKAVSIAAHVLSSLLFPRIEAFRAGSEVQEEAAQIMRDLMEWAAERYGYSWTALNAVIQALISPASIVHTEYTEVYRDVKRERQADGTYRTEKILDEDLSGFRDTVCRTDQIFIENFYEPDIQKQGFLIWRRVHDYRLMKAKYGHLPNFQYVKPGMQLLFNDANQGFYYVYDSNMRSQMCEEIIYWNKSMDVRLVFVNGILLTKHDEANPRQDKQYPFIKFGYELIHPQCFYYKSLVFKMAHDANILNSLYSMIIDGTYLNVMPPYSINGNEIIASDVMVPGKGTAFTDADSEIKPIKAGTDLNSGLTVLQKVEESVGESSEIQVSPNKPGQETAYEIAQREQERNSQLGLFVQMNGKFIEGYGKLRKGDIIQYMTVADVQKIEDDPQLVYKTFFMHKKDSKNGHRAKKITFDPSLPDHALTDDEKEEESFKTLALQGKGDVEICRVNPSLFRDLEFMVVVTPDVLTPRSEDVERMYMLEAYDRAIQNPALDQVQVSKDFLLSAYSKSARDPDKYIAKNPNQGGAMGGMAGNMPNLNQPTQQPNPMLQSMMQ